MLNLIQINRPLKVNGETFSNSQEAFEKFKEFKGELEIIIPPVSAQEEPKKNHKPKAEFIERAKRETEQESKQAEHGQEYRIKVRQYMTKPSSPGFDFMTKWNNDTPMPMRIMVGKIVQETKGMYKMELEGRPQATSVCMKCGRKLTNPVSLLYGIGPECGGHFHITAVSESELEQNMESIREKMAQVKWSGWIIKSAIEEMEKI